MPNWSKPESINGSDKIKATDEKLEANMNNLQDWVNSTGAWSGGGWTADKSTVGLGNVDNTSDLNKPISTSTQSALNGKENAFSKNTAFNKNFGTTSNTVCQGNDSRLSNSRPPTSHTHSISDVDNLQTQLDGKQDDLSNYDIIDYVNGDTKFVGIKKTGASNAVKTGINLIDSSNDEKGRLYYYDNGLKSYISLTNETGLFSTYAMLEDDGGDITLWTGATGAKVYTNRDLEVGGNLTADNLDYGTYVPAFDLSNSDFNITNAMYQRIGNIVDVTIKFSNNGGFNTFNTTFNLPIPSNFTVDSDCIGGGYGYGISGIPPSSISNVSISIGCNTSTNKATISYVNVDGVDFNATINFKYIVK
jgi:hypothetical protein